LSEEIDRYPEMWKSELEKAWNEIPKPFRSERAVHRTLQCRLYWIIRQLGLRTVADYMPPRIMDRPIDVIAANEQNEIIYAVCVDTLVTLPAVKSLNSFAAANKLIFTTGMLEKKVKESTFFLNEEIKHIHLKPFDR
jgi:hypothetical protein